MFEYNIFISKIKMNKYEEILKNVNVSDANELAVLIKYIQRYIDGFCVEYGERDIFLPELIENINICQAIRKKIPDTYLQNECLGTIIIGTVKNDIHSIGKDIVAAMLECYNFRVIDLGVDVRKEQFVNSAIENNADIICLSAMMINTMCYMQKIINEFELRKIREKYCIMVGGACVTEMFARQIGADIYTKNAVDALKEVKEYMLNHK